MSILKTSLGPSMAPSLGFRLPKVKVSLSTWLLIVVLGSVARKWRLLVALVAAFWVFRAESAFYEAAGWPGFAFLGGLTAFGVAGWALMRPEAAKKVLLAQIKAPARYFTAYRRHWQPAMVFSGLSQTYQSQEYLPKLVSVRPSRGRDVLRVKMLPGQVIDDYVKAAPRLAATFNLRDVRVKPVRGRPRLIDVIGLAADDPLRRTVGVPDPAPTPLIEPVQVGMREDGQPHHIQLLGNHLLVGGATGSGKGSVLYSLLLGLAPAIQADLVRVWAIDPKGGMELELGRPLFARFAYGPVGEETAQMLEFAVERMLKRADRLRQVGIRKLIPGDPEQEEKLGKREPLIVIVIDELASLVAREYVFDAKIRDRIRAALNLLLSQGRAVGISVVAAAQDIRMDTIYSRVLFSLRVALRVNESGQVDMLLGQGSRERGAFADKIRPGTATAGIGYVLSEDDPDPVRVRFGYTDDDAIERIVERYGRRPLAKVG